MRFALWPPGLLWSPHGAGVRVWQVEGCALGLGKVALEGQEPGGKPSIKLLPQQPNPGSVPPLPSPKPQAEGVFPLVVHLGGEFPQEAVEESPKPRGLRGSLPFQNQDQGGQHHAHVLPGSRLLA